MKSPVPRCLDAELADRDWQIGLGAVAVVLGVEGIPDALRLLPLWTMLTSSAPLVIEAMNALAHD
jgi:hypothetical protein